MKIEWNKVVVDGKEYKIQDAVEKMTVPDCFVLPANKIWWGHWEAKFYVGNEWEELRNFFGWKGFSIQCFLNKEDLIKYLDECKTEYKKPEQPYKKAENMPELREERSKKIAEMNDIIQFTLNEQTQIAWPRVYVNSDDDAYHLIRELSLPNITYLSALKLQDSEGNFVYYFRLFVDYFWEEEHPYEIEKQEQEIQQEVTKTDEEKKQMITARKWQWKYREELLKLCPFCPITMISDDRLLIASHIKPRAHSNDTEKIDPRNWFMFTPTFDLLFDRWYMTFSPDKEMIISPWISKMTCSKLNITPGAKVPLLPIEWREQYMEYHREHIFKG